MGKGPATGEWCGLSASGEGADLEHHALPTVWPVVGAVFEADEGGRVLAKIIGKKAPNFALDSLDGSKVDFHKVTNGKPTYLVFWGVG